MVVGTFASGKPSIKIDGVRIPPRIIGNVAYTLQEWLMRSGHMVASSNSTSSTVLQSVLVTQVWGSVHRLHGAQVGLHWGRLVPQL